MMFFDIGIIKDRKEIINGIVLKKINCILNKKKIMKYKFDQQR